MKVGDLVKAVDGGIGLVLDLDTRWVNCLWSDGAIAHLGYFDIEVIRESR